MKKIFTVVKQVSEFDIIVKDSMGREKRLHTDKTFTIGDSILVVNDVVIGTVKKQTQEIFEVLYDKFYLSSVIQVKLTRSDAVAGNILATFIDMHYEADSLGSNQEYLK